MSLSLREVVGLTAARRQNFLILSRRHCSSPLVEFISTSTFLKTGSYHGRAQGARAKGLPLPL